MTKAQLLILYDRYYDCRPSLRVEIAEDDVAATGLDETTDETNTCIRFFLIMQKLLPDKNYYKQIKFFLLTLVQYAVQKHY